MTGKRWRWVPNALTLVRLVLIVPFATALMDGAYLLALTLFALAAFTDGLDGFLARFFNWRTRVGAIADPLADKALLLTAYLMLTLSGELPPWLFAVVLGRDLVIIGGGLAFHYGIGRFDMQPSALGKLNTLVQVLVVLAIMIYLAGLPMPPWTITLGVPLVALSALVSGGHYVVVWTGRAWRAKNE